MLYFFRMALFAGLMLLAACAGEEAAPDLGPPEGWTGADGLWWREGFDTTGVFRDLETLGEMGVAESRSLFTQSVKQSLIRLYRNDPEIVDSLFEKHVAPKIKVDAGMDYRKEVDQYKRRGLDLIDNHYRAPRARLRLGQDIPVPYPDSLLQQRISGKVYTQIYLDPEGEPQAIALLEGVHPALDAIAMRAVTQQRWTPAYLLQKGRWRQLPAWDRFNVIFRAPES